MKGSSKLKGTIKLHQLWLSGDVKGKRLVVQDEDFTGVDFSNVDLRKSIFHSCNFVNCNFSESNFVGVDWRASSFSECDFTGSNMRDSYLRFCKFICCIFKMVDLNKAVLNGSDFIDIDFEGSRLTGLNFFNASERGCNFSRVIADGAVHLPLFTFSGIGDEAQSLVFNLKSDLVWFSDFIGSLDDFTKVLMSGKLIKNRLEFEVLRQVVGALQQYKVGCREESLVV
jgi:uncharacterized protein YjbI with pentapeptide repeats